MTFPDLPTASLRPHELNRRFPTKGEAWDQFLDSVREAGRILVRLTVRVHPEFPDEYEILAGHRRHAAARALGLLTVPCEVIAADDAAALKFLINENLQRAELSPIDESRFVRAMKQELALSDEEIAASIHRSLGWVRLRQELLDLGPEVARRVCLAPGTKGYLSLGSVAAIVEVPADLRPQAVQMVLHPELEEEALNERAARDVLKRCLVLPARERQNWDANKDKWLKGWKKLLSDALGARHSEGLLVLAVEWEDRQTALRGSAAALDIIPLCQLASAAPQNCRWLDLAVRHGVAVKIIPDPAGEKDTLAIVDASLLLQAEAAREEYGESPWLLRNPEKPAPTPPATEPSDEISDDDSTAPETHTLTPVTGPALTHSAWVDLTPVHILKAWADTSLADPSNAPDTTPPWVLDIIHNCGWQTLDATLDWIMKLGSATPKNNAQEHTTARIEA